MPIGGSRSCRAEITVSIESEPSCIADHRLANQPVRALAVRWASHRRGRSESNDVEPVADRRHSQSRPNSCRGFLSNARLGPHDGRSSKACTRAWVTNVTESVAEAHGVLEAFVRGQFVVMGAQALMYSFGLWLVGLNYAVLLGLMAGVAALIPYAGAVIGIGSAMIVGYFQFGLDPLALGLVASVFVAGQLIESFLLTPILIGDRIGLHPVAVIFALMAGGQLAGFTGVLVALPVAAVLLVFGRRLVDAYLSTDVYNAD